MRRYRELDEIGRIQLSRSFFMRDFLFSEIGAAFGIPNMPDDLDLAVYAGQQLCERILEPLRATFGAIHIRSGYRSSRLNRFGNERGLNCSSNDKTFADHIWDRRDAEGNAGACACVIIPWFAEHHRAEEWERLAWYLFDNLDFHRIVFFGRSAAANIGWRENPRREILSHIAPRGRLTGPGMLNGWGNHADQYPGFPEFHAATADLQRVASTRAKTSESCGALQITRRNKIERRLEDLGGASDRTYACDSSAPAPETQVNEGLHDK